MLKEIQSNALSTRSADGRGESGKAREMLTEKHSALLLASAQRLPRSDSEEDLEDFSSSGDEEKPAICPVPRRRLVQGRSSAANQQRPSALVDDVLEGIASLGLGSRSSNSAQAQPQASTNSCYAAAACAAAAAVETSDDEDNESDGDPEPFFERLAPSVEATVEAAGPSGPSTPEPGALALGERNKYVLAAAISQKLFPHQVQGIKWLWSLFDMQRGGILGDDMGLGKTMQCAAFLAGLFSSRLVRRALIIAPKTLLPHWIKELTVCRLRTLTREFFGTSESERAASLRSVVNGRGIIVTTYGMVQHNAQQLAGPAHTSSGDGFTWDLMLLDEGHKIKNPKMKLVEQLLRLPARMRIIISGTPIQNNLMEMHSLFDFTTKGLLGDAKTFKTNYERPITKGLDKDASSRERQTGAAIAAELRQRVEPFFLRREKKDVLPDNSSGNGASAESGPSTSAASTSADTPSIGQRAQGLPRKNDMVVWLRLTMMQRKIYTTFLHSDSVRMVLNEKASPLAAITVLKKICDHPALLSKRAATSVITAAHRWAKNGSGARNGGRRRDSDDFIADSDEDLEDSSDDSSEGVSISEDEGIAAAGTAGKELPADWLSDGATIDSELTRELEQRGAEASCKSVFVLALLEQLHSEGHRTLIFSQSKVMLSILEAGVKAMKLAYCRIDGDIVSAEERHAHVQRFQDNDDIPVFLLTSQVGGLGLTLTAADRVIIVDPAWNPSVDNQSVDRAYRMGQTRDVVVYRLITCGTVEEKIYRKQVFKGGLSKTGTEEGIQFRYFSQTDLRDLFAVTPEGLQQSETQLKLNEMHSHQRTATEGLQRHLEQVLRMENVAGIHDHNLLFTQRPQEQAPTAQEGAAILSQMSRSGPVGVDALTNMLVTGLRINGNVASTKHQAEVDQARRKVEDLATRVSHTKRTIATGMTAKLPDGGAKMMASLAVLQNQYDEAVAVLNSLEDGADFANGSTGSGGGAPGSSQSGGGGPGGGAVAARNNGVAGSDGQNTGASNVDAHRMPTTMLAGSVGAVPAEPTPKQPQVGRPAVRPGGFGAGIMFRSSGGGGSSGSAASGSALGSNPAARSEQQREQQHRSPSASPPGTTELSKQHERHQSGTSSVMAGRGGGTLDGSRGAGGPVGAGGEPQRLGGDTARSSGSDASTGSTPRLQRRDHAAFDVDDVSFVTADSTGTPGGGDDVTSNVIDLTDTP